MNIDQFNIKLSGSDKKYMKDINRKFIGHTFIASFIHSLSEKIIISVFVNWLFYTIHPRGVQIIVS